MLPRPRRKDGKATCWRPAQRPLPWLQTAPPETKSSGQGLHLRQAQGIAAKVWRSAPIYVQRRSETRQDEDQYPLIVKVDIEGDERGLFAQDTEWVCQTPVIFVEPHDWMLPKQSTVRSFLALMASQKRDILVQHENIVAVAHELE
jgi:hypothetical protein